VVFLSSVEVLLVVKKLLVKTLRLMMYLLIHQPLKRLLNNS
jgi:hypothetical protein